MSEKTLRNIFLFGTVFFLLVLGGMTVDSLSKVSSIRTPTLTDQVVAGKRVWQSKNCNDCHTILGIGGYFAPELTKLMDRHDAAELRDWLKDPQAVKPGTTMPNQHLTHEEVDNLVAFFQWVNRIDTNEWPPQPWTAGGTGLSGALLFQQKGCSGCHMVNGQGAPGPGPELSHIGSQPYNGLPNTPEFLAKWLENPQAQKSGSAMPRIPMTQAERDALVQYLTGLK